MQYLKSEHLKYKRTVTNKLLFVAPFITALFAWIVGGFYGFQYMSFYWWYAFLLPGTIAILCGLSHQQEERAGKYYAVLSMPLDLARFELAKALILVEKLLAAALFLALFVSVNSVISPATSVYPMGRSILGSIGIILASIWQIPMCLYITRKTGMLLPVILNSILGILSPTMLGNTSLWFLWPYCFSAKLAEPLMGIAVNGTYTGSVFFSWSVPMALLLSILLFALFALADTKSFSGREGR